MIAIISLPPVRLAEIVEQALDLFSPTALAGCSKREQQTAFSRCGTDGHPGFVTHAGPIQRCLHFQESIQPAESLGALVDSVPDTGAGGFDTTAIGIPASPPPVAQPLGTKHRADESRLSANCRPFTSGWIAGTMAAYGAAAGSAACP